MDKLLSILKWFHRINFVTIIRLNRGNKIQQYIIFYNIIKFSHLFMKVFNLLYLVLQINNNDFIYWNTEKKKISYIEV